MFDIDINKCTGCGTCSEVCPQQAIAISNGLATINQELCTQCGTCAEACPIGAVCEVEPAHIQLSEGGDNIRGRGGFGWGWVRGGRVNHYLLRRFNPWLPRRCRRYGYPGYDAYYSVHAPYRVVNS
jgi:NAD-dependent dihydropyrimidine dehydrogenase PreA subunit